jgi:membrane peptidoglycan carboxypeptidase
VARNFFLSSKRTLDRKIREAMLAVKIEQQLDKDQILELYMNQIYLGHRAYGFGAAAQVYFGKPLDQLTIAEDAMLAGLPQNPGYANPITNLERAVARQHVVLGRMLATGVITQAQYDEAKAQKLVIRSRTRWRCMPSTWPRWPARSSTSASASGLQRGLQGHHLADRGRPAGRLVRAAPRRAGPRAPPGLARAGGPGGPGRRHR